MLISDDFGLKVMENLDFLSYLAKPSLCNRHVSMGKGLSFEREMLVWNAARLLTKTFTRSNLIQVLISLYWPCGGNFSNVQSQLFSSEEIRGFYNNILQERTTQYRIQSCSDH